MRTDRLQALLARLYTDPALCGEVLADPDAAARALGLDEEGSRLLRGLDRVGLALASRSFAAKRRHRPQTR